MKRGRALAAALTLVASNVLSAPAAAVDRRVGGDVPQPALVGRPWSSDATAQLARDLDAQIAAAPTLRGAHVGLLVVDTGSGAVLYARNADDTFVPASTMKLLTGSAALATLGPSYRFRTDAFVDAAKTALIIRTGGDPFLGVADLDAMAQTIRAAGIGALPQGVRIDATAFERAPYPPGWSWDDFPYDYAPALSAAVIEENVVHLTIVPGTAIGRLARVSETPTTFDRHSDGPIEGCSDSEFDVVLRATTAAPGTPPTLGVAREGGCIAVTGSIALDARPQTIDASVPNPVRYLQGLAETALRGAGVSADGRAAIADSMDTQERGADRTPPDADPIWTHVGEPLADVLADMWWPSDNLVAEQLLKAIAVQYAGSPGTIDNGAAAERAWLTRIGVDPATLTIADGSGLSTYDRITPRALVAILQADWNGPYRKIVLGDLPIAGVRGTLQDSFAGTLAERRTFAKTGSVMHARGLAGYLATLHHGALTFAWSVDDWLGDNADLAALRGRVLARIIGD